MTYKIELLETLDLFSSLAFTVTQCLLACLIQANELGMTFWSKQKVICFYLDAFFAVISLPPQKKIKNSNKLFGYLKKLIKY